MIVLVIKIAVNAKKISGDYNWNAVDTICISLFLLVGELLPIFVVYFQHYRNV